MIQRWNKLWLGLSLLVGAAACLANAPIEWYSPEQRNLGFDSCKHLFPKEQPLALNQVPREWQAIALCSDNFAVLYSQLSKTPLIVVERLNADLLREARGEARTDVFFADPRIPPAGRAELEDYRGQEPAVDRGHLAPAADAPDSRAMAQSFALSNIVPQDPESNRKAWKEVETSTRKFALRARANVYVFSGPLFDAGYRTVGKNKVWKPTRLFKLVYDEGSGRAWAHILPNEAARVTRPMDYATFVRETGLRLLDGLTITGSAGRL